MPIRMKSLQEIMRAGKDKDGNESSGQEKTKPFDIPKYIREWISPPPSKSALPNDKKQGQAGGS